MSNLFWIYSLHIFEIKTEGFNFFETNPSHGIKAHFMNVLINISNENLGKINLQKIDKRLDLPFLYVQYIKFSSYKPVKQAYNTPDCKCLTRHRHSHAHPVSSLVNQPETHDELQVHRWTSYAPSRITRILMSLYHRQFLYCICSMTFN